MCEEIRIYVADLSAYNNGKLHGVWIKAQMSVLFEKGRSTITEHIANIFIEGELDEKVVCRNFRLTTQHGAIEGKTQAKE